jgi:hypothetical protein
MDVTDGIAAGNGPDVERSVVTAGATKPFSFLGTMCSAENQELLERRAVPSAAWRRTRLWR